MAFRLSWSVPARGSNWLIRWLLHGLNYEPNQSSEPPEALLQALKRRPIDLPDSGKYKVLDYIDENTPAAIFFAEDYANKPAQTNDRAVEQSEEDGQDRRGFESSELPVDSEWVGVVDFLVGELPKDALVIELGGGVYQDRGGFMYKHFQNYVPLNISTTSIARYAQRHDRWGIACDATRLPFKDASVDCVFSRTTVEHVQEPGQMFAEVARVLKPDGIVLHADAWFCRWWQRHGVVGHKRFANMSFGERLVWVGSRVTEFPAVRLPPIIALRLFRELLISRKRLLPLPFRRLQPNYNLHLGSDEDAAASIDSLNVVRFYESRGFSLVKPMTFTERILLRNKEVILRREGREKR